MNRKLTPKAEGLKKYAEMDEDLKCELITEKAEDVFSEYTLGDRSSSISAAARTSPPPRKSKLSSCSRSPALTGKATSTIAQRQRIYGTSFFTKKELDEYLQPAGRSKEARPPQARPGARSIQHSGAGRAGADFLPPQGRTIRQASSKTGCAISTSSAATRSSTRRTSLAPRPLEDLRALRISTPKTCSSGWSWTTPNTSSSR